MKFEDIDKSLFAVNQYSEQLNKIIDEIVDSVCKSLDEYMKHIDECLCNSQKVLTDESLEIFILNLPALIYFTSEHREKILIKEEISKEVYREVYGEARKEITGTLVDKDLFGKSKASVQALTTLVYHSAYSRIKAKEEGATEMLNSLKKVMNRRVAELELSRGVKN